MVMNPMGTQQTHVYKEQNMSLHLRLVAIAL